MRVTNAALGAQVARDLQAALAAIARQHDHLSSGRRLLTPADDPGGAAQAVTIRSRRAATAQYQLNVADARDSLHAADGVLGAAIEAITRVREIAIQGASDTNDALARQSLGAEVDQLLEALVSLANSRSHHGEFLFGGQESTRPPYAATRDADGRITAVTPNPRGIDDPVVAEVAEGVTIATRVSGNQVFGAPGDPAYAFDVLIHLRDRLDANDNGPGGIGATLDDLAAVLDRILVPQTLVGARLGWIALLEDRLGAESVTQAAALSRVEDLDVVRAIQEFQQMKTFYESALASGASVLRLSLLDFLR